MKDLNKIRKIQENATCLYTQEQVEEAIEKVAKQMNEKFKDEFPVLLCVMKGAVVFMGQLITKLNFPLQIDYIHATRFRGEMTGGDLLWITKPTMDLKDRTVIVIEDILDSGLTLASIMDYCNQQKAKEVYNAVLIDKDCPREQEGVKEADFTGIHVENKFIIGYGLDYKDCYRNIPGIYVVNQE